MKNTVFIKTNNEEGSVIVYALLILAVLTILGVSSINTSTIELQIVRNERVYQQNFYNADSAAHEAAKHIEEEVNTDQLIPASTSLDWLNNSGTVFSQSENWNDIGQDSGNVADNSDPSSIAPNTLFATSALGVRSGSSLDIGSSRLYEFAVFGLSQENSGKVLIEVGYLRRF